MKCSSGNYTMIYSIFIFFLIPRINAMTVDCIKEAKKHCPSFVHPDKTDEYCRTFGEFEKCFKTLDIYCFERFQTIHFHNCLTVPKRNSFRNTVSTGPASSPASIHNSHLLFATVVVILLLTHT
ncbi:uncharacterized protein LOC128249755 [Octopus bimaculoides]|uniref:uncharacterized protein LOC128249755 n=1 Tax=Octopus bimaculoides TaxID=37653 RepID=UPI0022E145A0|nr:uncharacterized protein LOC128249755 [Octopus bimaculoides]